MRESLVPFLPLSVSPGGSARDRRRSWGGIEPVAAWPPRHWLIGGKPRNVPNPEPLCIGCTWMTPRVGPVTTTWSFPATAVHALPVNGGPAAPPTH